MKAREGNKMAVGNGWYRGKEKHLLLLLLLLAILVKYAVNGILWRKVQCRGVVWMLKCFLNGENYVIIV